MSENKFVNLTKQEIHTINNFLDGYEYYLEKQGYSFSKIKEISQNKREIIFKEIEDSMENSGSYNLSKIIEKYKPKRKIVKNDKDEIVLNIPIPTSLSLFSLNNKNKKNSVFNFNNQKNMLNTKYKNWRNKRKKIIFYEPPVDDQTIITNESNPAKHSIETNIHEVSQLLEPKINYNLNVDVVKAQKYVNLEYFRKKSILKKFHLFFILFTLLELSLFGGIIVDIYLYNTLNQNLDGTTYNYRGFYFYWNLPFIYLMVVFGIYFSYLLIHVIVLFFLKRSKSKLENEVVRLILFSYNTVSQYDIPHYGQLIYKLIYRGIITLDIPEEEKE